MQESNKSPLPDTPNIKARLLEIEACLNDIDYSSFEAELKEERMLLLKAMYGIIQAETIRLTINSKIHETSGIKPN